MRAAAASAAAAAAAFCLTAAQALENGVARTPPLGWSTWETCGDTNCTKDVCTEAEVKASADAMARSGLLATGWNYVVLDDCWAARERNARDDSITWNHARFPSGIPALATWLHARHFRLGLYTSAGRTTCHGGLPGSEGHYEQDAATFAAWGVDYVKFDWCGDSRYEPWTGKAAHVRFASALNATGRPIALEVVAGYAFLGAEISQYANSWRFCVDHHDTWASTRAQLECVLDGGPRTSAPGGWASLDMLTTGGAGCASGAHCPGQTDAEYATEFVSWLMLQSPLFVATDVRRLSPVMASAIPTRAISHSARVRTGTLPAQLSQLSSITTLVLAGNVLSSTIPADLYKRLKAMRPGSCELSGNCLSGTLTVCDAMTQRPPNQCHGAPPSPSPEPPNPRPGPHPSPTPAQSPVPHPTQRPTHAPSSPSPKPHPPWWPTKAPAKMSSEPPSHTEGASDHNALPRAAG